MSVSHPVLKELKSTILDFRSEEGLCVNDSNKLLLHLCNGLEVIFRLGLKSLHSVVGIVKQDYWTVIKLVGLDKNEKAPYQIKKLVSNIEESQKVRTLQGRGRLFIRSTLQQKRLREIMLFVTENMPDVLAVSYTEKTSILGNEILREIFISLLFELEEVNFNLNLQNSSFLDESWLLPVYRCYEFIMCESLGIATAYAKGRVVVLSLKENGVAAEENKISVGDVLDQVNDEHLYNCPRSRVLSLFRLIREAPIKVSVVKCLTKDGRVFPPLVPILNELKLDRKVRDQIKSIAASKNSDSTSPAQSTDVKSLYRFDSQIRFLGKTTVGVTGTTGSIDAGMTAVLGQKEISGQAVSIEIGDAYITITNMENETELFRHSFTRIGSCGKRVDTANHFCYIVGETTCNLAKEFECLVFEAESPEQANAILHAIARGFKRTHWAV